MPLDQIIARATAKQPGDVPDSDQPGDRPAPTGSAFPVLTAREMEVLALLVDGRTNPEIAEVLFISPRTVSVHVTHILEKLGVENRSAAVAFALRWGRSTRVPDLWL